MQTRPDRLQAENRVPKQGAFEEKAYPQVVKQGKPRSLQIQAQSLKLQGLRLSPEMRSAVCCHDERYCDALVHAPSFLSLDQVPRRADGAMRTWVQDCKFGKSLSMLCPGMYGFLCTLWIVHLRALFDLSAL